MRFKYLQQQVQGHEERLEERSQQVVRSWLQLGQQWKVGWTPWRIVLAGVACGFVVGKAAPLQAVKRLSAVPWMGMINGASGVFAMIQDVMQQVAVMQSPQTSTEDDELERAEVESESTTSQ